MQFQSIDWKRGIMLGAIAGIAWGWIAMAVNAATGAFEFENTLLHNLIAFAAGGAVFGIVVSGFLSLLKERLPFKNIFLKATLLSSVLWIMLKVGGTLLSSVEPERYHPITAQSIQGFVLAIIMGGLLGFLWKIKSKEA
ncbi:MAG: hypothetical protein HZB81_02795 [Deltaproteobacteria bacterium]|nr:hypothetical protein [Deltaproteobacteria bacterium]